LIDPAEIAAARETLPERAFAQEYLAEFTDAVGAVFRNVRACATATRQTEAIPGHRYIFGADWGRVNYATCLAVIDATISALVEDVTIVVGVGGVDNPKVAHFARPVEYAQ